MHGILQVTYVDRSESAVEALLGHFFFFFKYIFKNIFYAYNIIFFSVATQFTRSFAAFYESESENWFCVKFVLSLRHEMRTADGNEKAGRHWKLSLCWIEKLGASRRSLPSIALVYGSRHPNLKKVFTKLVGALRPGYRAEVMKCEHPWRGVALLYKRLFVRSLPAFITDDLPTPSADPPPPSTHDISFTAAGRNSVRIERRSGDG